MLPPISGGVLDRPDGCDARKRRGPLEQLPLQARRAARCPHNCAGAATRTVARRSGCRPRSSVSRRCRLRPSSPAPTSSTMATASSRTTIFEPSRRQVRPADPRDGARGPFAIAGPRHVQRAASPRKTTAASAADHDTEQQGARAERDSVQEWHSRQRVRRDQTGSTSRRPNTTAPSRSPGPGRRGRRIRSTNCATTRPDDAPSALRTASSRLRLSDRTTSRPATLRLAMTISSAAPPSSSHRMGRTLPTTTSVRSTTVAP